MACSDNLLVTLAWRYGNITVPPHDTVIGRSLMVYGEWAQNEIDTLRSLIPEGGVVLDVGAFLGTHSIALAERVGPQGRVVALEPQPQVFDLLLRNLNQNRLYNVDARNCAAAATRQLLPFPHLDLCSQRNFANTTALAKTDASLQTLLVPAITLDEIELARLDLIKIDAEGMERQIVGGALATLERHRPILYIECRSVSGGLDLFSCLREQSYRVFLHRPSAFNPQNYRGVLERIFGLARETNLLAIASEVVDRYEPQLAENPDLLVVDEPEELARRLLDTPRWGESEWETLPRAELIARMTHLLEEQQAFQSKLNAERSERQSVEETRDLLLRELERERRGLAPEERLSELEREITVARLAAQGEARDRLKEVANSIELRKQVAALEVELEQVRFETTWKVRFAQSEGRKLRRDLALLTESLQAAAPSGVRGSVYGVPLTVIEESALDIIRALFDEDFYRRLNPESDFGLQGALEHFLRQGGLLGRDPHVLFDSSFYLERNPDVRQVGINPLVHFILHGATEHRDPHPLFDVSYYLSQLARDVTQRPGFNPLLHFVREGAYRELNPHPLFISSFYLEQVPSLRRSGTNPLSHYVTEGAWLGYDPHPFFDSSYSLERYPQPRLAAMDPLSRFLCHGGAAGEDPHPFFSSVQYCAQVRSKINNPLLHFQQEGSCAGLAPRQTYNLTRDQSILRELDQLRQDGLPVLLLISHMGGGGTEKHVRELAACLSDRCHVFLLRPANHHLLGPATRGQVALSPLEKECPGLLFDPAEQLQDLVTVLRGIGVERIHIHQLEGNQDYLRKLVTALDLPFDFTVHDYRVLSPRFSQNNHPQVFPGDESEDMSPVSSGGATTPIAEWRREHAWVINEAERVLAPSADSARRVGRVFPGARCQAVAHPELPSFDPLHVVPLWLRANEALRVLLIGEFLPHKGEGVVRDVCRRLSETGELVEVHLIGFLSSGETITGLRDHGRYRDSNLASLIERVAPHVAWFPAQWPETYSYTLSAALRSGLPVIVSDIGALPERVGGRPWSWVRSWTSTPDNWCEAFLEIRRCILERCAPEPPEVQGRANGKFYPDEYLNGWQIQ